MGVIVLIRCEYVIVSEIVQKDFAYHACGGVGLYREAKRRAARGAWIAISTCANLVAFVYVGICLPVWCMLYLTSCVLGVFIFLVFVCVFLVGFLGHLSWTCCIVECVTFVGETEVSLCSCFGCDFVLSFNGEYDD